MAVEVERSVTVESSPAAVWARVGPFGAIGDWHPAIATCALQERDGVSHRLLTTGDGAQILERLLGHDNGALWYRYAIVDSPLPVDGYESEVSVAADDAGARVVWKSRFEAKGASEAEAEALIGGIYDAGLANIGDLFRS